MKLQLEKKHLHSLNLNSVDLVSQLREVTCFYSSLKGVCDLLCHPIELLLSLLLCQNHTVVSPLEEMTPTEDLVTGDKFRDTQV